uniref:PB1 domain-containing protein n=1 Tax=Setaria digitata TaxID=48799 RepID=A0A915PW27_9BILA
MHLIIEKYHNYTSSIEPPEPILVPFKRYSRECVVSAIMEFINYNFIMDAPPKYRDSEGDMILLETREAFEAAVDDALQTPSKFFVVHVDGFYKFQLSKKESPKLSISTQAGCSCDACAVRDLANFSMDRVMREVKEEVNKQIIQNPVIDKLGRFMEEYKRQKACGACCSKQKSTQTFQANVSDAAVGMSSSISIQGQSSSKVLCGESSVGFQLAVESPVWDVKAIYERKTMPLKKWENPSSSDLLETVHEGEGIYSKRWVLRRFACESWENVSINNETISDALEIYRSKMVVTNLPQKGQIVDFTVWLKCSASTGYFCATWQLYKMTESCCSRTRGFTRSEFKDARELEELASSGSVSASDYEVIDGGETVDDSDAKQ